MVSDTQFDLFVSNDPVQHQVPNPEPTNTSDKDTYKYHDQTISINNDALLDHLHISMLISIV